MPVRLIYGRYLSLVKYIRKVLKSMKKIKVSIIVPVYNIEKYLKRCLNSLINQSLYEIEIICVNDGSTDKSLSILEDFSANDDRMKIINQVNSGQAVARNNGIESANGEFICFVDGDDWIDLNFCEKLYEAATRTNSDIAVGGMIRLHTLRKKYHLKFKQEKVLTNNNDKFSVLDIPDKSYACGRLYRRDFFLNTGLKFEPGRVFEDAIFTPQIVLKSDKLVVVPDVYYYYWRRFFSTVTNKNSKFVADKRYAWAKAKEIIKKAGIELPHKEVTKRVRILNFTVYKTRTKHGKTRHYLFNLICW